jgi:excisionase family DNA binding protein
MTDQPTTLKLLPAPAFEPMLSVPDLAAALNCNPVFVRAEIKSGALPALRLGAHWRVRPEDLRAYIRKAAEAQALPRQQAAQAAATEAAAT